MHTRHGHIRLPAGLLLVDRPVQGWELAAVDLLRLPDGTDPDLAVALVADHLAQVARGLLDGHTVGLLTQRWSSRPVPAHQMARDIAHGRTPQMRQRVKVWEPHQVFDGGRVGPILGLHDRFDQAVQVLLRNLR